MIFLIVYCCGALIGFLIQALINFAFGENMDWPLIARVTLFWPYYAVMVLIHIIRR